MLVCLPDGLCIMGGKHHVCRESDRMDAFALSPFVIEWLVGNRPPNQLPISAQCNAHCLFCSNHLNPFPVISGMFREMEDVKLQLAAMSANDDPIRLSDSLPGRISEGEALLHPQLFEILDLIRRKFFYSKLCFTTNASMLDEEFIRRLAPYRPIEITISMHSTQPELWAKIFRKTAAEARNAIAAPTLLKRSGIEMLGTIVPLPKVCGWDDVEKTYGHLVEGGAKEIILFWPGHTVRTKEAVKQQLECPLEDFTAWAQRMKQRHPSVKQSPLPDMGGPLEVAVGPIVAKTLGGNPKSRGGPYGRVVWLTSVAAHDRLLSMVEQASVTTANSHHVRAVQSLTYGGNIMVSGLLTVSDFIGAGRTARDEWPDIDLFVVPTTPFDSLYRDLLGQPALLISEALGRPVWLASPGGSIDSLLGFRLVERHRRPDQGFVAAMRGANEVRHDAPLLQRFEVLDETHVLCLESWPSTTSDHPIQRWTRLEKTGTDWHVTSVEESR
jgi:uncharacterized Fe-S cluster-containing radical SAM superfamily protein